MKKTLAIVAVALFVGTPLFAENFTTMTYTLQMGGKNAAEQGWTGSPATPPVFDTTASNFVEAGTVFNENGAYTGDVFTWSVRVAVGGTYSPTTGLADETPVDGAANLVWDLAVKDSSNNLVAVGHGSPTTAGFFSTVKDGVKAYGTEPLTVENAAFPWVVDPFGLGTPHRIWDTTLDGGVGMLQYTYPNTAGYKAGSTAQSGTLMGMGAGYKDFAAVEQSMTGVIGGLGGGNNCVIQMGNLPIAEGQISLAGLPNGTYTLELTPGKGNNALWVSPQTYCFLGQAGAFAVPVATVTASTLQFVKNGTAVEKPALASSASGKTHGTAGEYMIPFAGETATNPGGVTSIAVEDRLNGVTKAVFTFKGELSGLPMNVTTPHALAPVIGDEVIVACTNAAGPVTLTGTAATITGNVLTVTFANMPAAATGGSCLKITLHNIQNAAAPAGVMADVCKSIKILRGDVTGDGQVLANDVSATKAGFANINGNPNYFRRDVAPSGDVLANDVSAVKASGGDISGLTCGCP